MHNQRKPFFLENHCSLPPNTSVCVYSLFFSHHHPSDLRSFFIPLAPLSCHSGTTEWDKEPKQPHLPPASRSALRVPKPCAHHAQGTGGGGVGWGRRGSGLNVRGATAGQGIQVSNRISQASPFIIIISPLFFLFFLFKGYHPRSPAQQHEAKLPHTAASRSTDQRRCHQHAAQPLAQLALPSQKPRCGAAVPSGAPLCSTLPRVLTQRCIPAAARALRSSSAMPWCWPQANVCKASDSSVSELCGQVLPSTSVETKSNMHKLMICYRDGQNERNFVILLKLLKHKGKAIFNSVQKDSANYNDKSIFCIYPLNLSPILLSENYTASPSRGQSTRCAPERITPLTTCE